MKEDYELVGNDPEDEVAAAYVVAEMGGFSRDYVRLVADYYNVLKKPFIPDYALSGCKFVLVPVHMKALKHWMIQIVEIKMTDADTTKHKIWATFYDPLGVGSNLDICESKWSSFTLPLLESWFKRDMDREKLRNLIPKNRLKRSASAARSRESGDDTPEMQFPDVLAVRMTRPTQRLAP
eukprot:jgi/Phyca11/16217/fgenesh1_pg.PHYCAscaffold_18_\